MRIFSILLYTGLCRETEWQDLFSSSLHWLVQRWNDSMSKNNWGLDSWLTIVVMILSLFLDSAMLFLLVAIASVAIMNTDCPCSLPRFAMHDHSPTPIRCEAILSLLTSLVCPLSPYSNFLPLHKKGVLNLNLFWEQSRWTPMQMQVVIRCLKIDWPQVDVLQSMPGVLLQPFPV